MRTSETKTREREDDEAEKMWNNKSRRMLRVLNNIMYKKTTTCTHRHTQNKIKNFQSAGSDPCVCCEREQRSEWRQQQQHSSSGTIATAITFAKYIK